jgi:hypothetical protein
MRKFLKIIGVLAVLGGIGAGLAFWLTSGMVEVASGFIGKIRAGNAKAAYEMTSPAFQKATPLKTFEAYVDRTGLKAAGEPSWSSRNVSGTGDNAVGTVSGTLKDAKGTATPLRIQLTKNAGKWVVQHFRVSPAGVAGNSDDILAEKDLITLVQDSNLIFTKAVEAKNLKPFFENISDRWRKQTSLEQLDKAFSGFTSRNAKFSGLEKLTPAFDGPAKVDENGIMQVSGSYETRPLRITFTHKYVKEGLSWKLFGFRFNLKPVDKPVAPAK